MSSYLTLASYPGSLIIAGEEKRALFQSLTHRIPGQCVALPRNSGAIVHRINSDAIDPDKAEGEDWVSREIKGLSGKLEGFGRICAWGRGETRGLIRKLEGSVLTL